MIEKLIQSLNSEGVEKEKTFTAEVEEGLEQVKGESSFNPLKQ